MSITAIEFPKATGTSTKKSVLTPEEIKQAVKLLKSGKAVSDDQVHPAKGKATAKTRA